MISKHHFSNTEFQIKIQYDTILLKLKHLKVKQYFYPNSNNLEQSKLVNATLLKLFTDATIWETKWNYAFENVHSTNLPNSLLVMHYTDSYMCNISKRMSI